MADGNQFYTGSAADTTVHQVTTQIVSIGTGVAMWLDGASQTLTPGAGGAPGSFDIIGQFAGGVSNGWITELLYYNVALGSTDRQAVELYLKNKWATP
jgi:hypothetical protein